MAVRITYDSDSFGQTYTNSSGEEEYIERGRGFEINAIAEDTDTGEIYYSVECEKLGKITGFEISKSQAMDCNIVKQYNRLGLDVSDSNKMIVPEVFQRKEDDFVMEGNIIQQVHSQAGVKTCTDASGKEITVFAGAHNPITGSTYKGMFDIEPKGDKQVWYDMVKEQMKDNIQIQFVISLGFASILLGVLRGLVDVDNILCHLRGDSSSGKTSMLNLGISIFGNPNECSPSSLVSSWNGTRNALLRRLLAGGDSKGGLMFGLDEFSMLRDKDVSGLVYSICSGIEKDRLTRDARVQNRLTGTYIVLSTGESSIISRTNGNIGIQMRVLEMDCQHAWTTSAFQSETIKKVVKSNYGFAAEDFGLSLGRWLQENGMDALIERFEYWRSYYCDTCMIRERRERMSSRYALVLLGAEMSKILLDLDMDVEGICEFLIENENTNNCQRNSYSDFYNKLVAYIMASNEHFIRPDDDAKSVKKDSGVVAYKPAFKEQWGKIEPVQETIELPDGGYAQSIAYIALPFFEDIAIRKLGYEDDKALRKWLKKEHYTLCEPDRDYYRKVINGIKNSYIAVYLPGIEDQGEIARADTIRRLLSDGDKCKKFGSIDKLSECIEKLLDFKSSLDSNQKKRLNKLIDKHNAMEQETSYEKSIIN